METKTDLAVMALLSCTVIALVAMMFAACAEADPFYAQQKMHVVTDDSAGRIVKSSYLTEITCYSGGVQILQRTLQSAQVSYVHASGMIYVHDDEGRVVIKADCVARTYKEFDRS